MKILSNDLREFYTKCNCKEFSNMMNTAQIHNCAHNNYDKTKNHNWLILATSMIGPVHVNAYSNITICTHCMPRIYAAPGGIVNIIHQWISSVTTTATWATCYYSIRRYPKWLSVYLQEIIFTGCFLINIWKFIRWSKCVILKNKESILQ